MTLWEGTIRPHVLSQMETIAGGSIAVDTIRPSYDFREHTIRATVEGVAFSGTATLEREITTRDEVDFGKIVRETWPFPSEVEDDEQDEFPKPTPAYVYQGARVITRTITTRTLERTASAINVGIRNHRSRALAQAPTGSGGDTPSNAVLMTRTSDVRKVKRGLKQFGSQINLIERIVVEVFRIVVNLSEQEPAGAVVGGVVGGAGGAAAGGAAGGRRQ